MSGRNKYEPSSSDGYHRTEKDGGYSNRRILRLRNIWNEFRKDWIKLNRPESYKVVIIGFEEKENFEFRTQKRAGGYVIECDKFSWVDD